MKLWLISQEENTGYDVYDSAVVAAETEQSARETDPSGNDLGFVPSCGWVTDLSFVKVKYLGEAAPDIQAGVICASFNAG